MKYYLENTYYSKQKELVPGVTVKVPLLEEEATVISVKGKNCLAQLKKLGAVVSFQLN